MRDLLGPFRASLSLGRRRAVVLVLLVVIAIAGAISWTTYRPLRQQRAFLAALEGSALTQDSFFRFAPGISCFGGDFGPGFAPGFGPKPGADATATGGGTPTTGATSSPATEPQPEPVGPTCQFVDPDGAPIGTPFTGDPFGPRGLSQETLDEIKPVLIDGQLQIIAQTERDLAPRRLLESRIRMLGTFLGIGFMVLLAATFFGAEYRWGIWPTLLTHEPRRGLVLAGKLLALWVLVITFFVVALGVVSGVDGVMRALDDVTARGGPEIAKIAKQAGWAILSLEMYATIAASLALILRTTVGGIAALLVTLGDHLAVAKYHWLRNYLPTQQIASLLPMPDGVTSGYAWFPRITAGVRCREAPEGGFDICTEIMLRPPPQWRASLVLVAWAIGASLLAWMALRRRDVPQS